MTTFAGRTTLADFHDLHRDNTVIVCGCGESLNLLTRPPAVVTIGVNDVGRRFTPDYLVVVNPRAQFSGDRFRHVEQSRAKAIFTQCADAVKTAAPIVRFKLGRYRGTDFGDPNVLHFTKNSPYVAICLAIHMGAKRIGVLGVDFTDHHFFGQTGRHRLTSQLATIDQEYRSLREAAAARGITIVNLSPVSRLTAFEKGSLDDMAGTASVAVPARFSTAKALQIVSYATTPVAGVPAILARCISAQTIHGARCVWATDRYGNGVAFAGDLEWNSRPNEAERALEAADVVVVHNGKVDPRHERILSTKRVVTMAHNYMWNVDRRFVARGGTGLVVGQYQATLPEFAGWIVVPNPVPSWEPAYAPLPKPGVVTICYTPSGHHERYPAGHRLHWHAKGYDTTMRVLDGLARTMPLSLEVVRDGQVTHAAALDMKRRAHIVIDECVTGSYHRNSLEGLSAGCVVVNGVGLLPGVAETFRHCAPTSGTLPFVFSDLTGLDAVLRALIERGPDALEAQGRQNRLWMEQHWDFPSQWARVWEAQIVGEPAATPSPIRRAAGQPAAVRPLRKDVVDRVRSESVSVIVPHGGTERLSQLEVTVATLRQRPAVGEIVIVEMGESPVAADVASRWADKHLFLQHAGPFERARALNAGSAIADHDYVLWHDNDLLTSASFIQNSIRELRDRRLDYLTPYTSVRYLSEADSHAVMQGARSPEDCKPVQVFYSARVSFGAMGLVRREFLARHGGHVEGFRGWGGEDNAWNRKVSLLGRSARTTQANQHAHHLYHPLSNGYATGAASGNNPFYEKNVELMRRIKAVRTARDFVKEFPAVPPATGTLTRTNGSVHTDAGSGLAVWTYWEGPCPAWILACRKTILAHASEVRILTPETFDRLRDRDRDIDLSRLHAPHRADYVRAFLLHRHGGLWIDADCLVMQPLKPVLDLLERHDFVGHRERAGLISNAFIAARPGSRIASAFYERVCESLRSRRPIRWNGIGADPLTAIVAADATGWHELPCERVQPVCWSRPQEFFVARSDEAHAAAVDGQALCYMLSNGAIKNYTSRHGQVDLMHERTFFRFLLNRTLAHGEGGGFSPHEQVFAAHYQAYRRSHYESGSGPGSSVAHTLELRERLPLVLQDLRVRTLLDAACGDFNWMQHVRLDVAEYIGADILADLVAENQARHGNRQRRFIRADLVLGTLPRADAIFCRDLLVQLSFADVFNALRNFKRSGATYLMTTTFTRQRPNLDIATGGWRTLNFTLPPFNFPPPVRVISEKCSEGGGAFSDKSVGVWCLDDLCLSGDREAGA